jgi:hypothetical protein
MSFRRQIPSELIELYPTLTIQQIRSMVNMVWRSYGQTMAQAEVFDIRLRKIGRVKTHGNKKSKAQKKKYKK